MARRAPSTGSRSRLQPSELSAIRPKANGTDTASNAEHTSVDLGFGLILAVLAGKDCESAQIWDSLSTNRTDSPFHADDVVSPTYMEPSWREQTLLHLFPSLDEALRLADKGFYVCYRVHEAINKDDFIKAIKTLYDTSYNDPEFPYLDCCTLLAAVIALAYALDADSHKHVGCSGAMSQSQSYIAFAHANLGDKLTSIMSLRATVMIILFHLFTNNAQSAFRFLPSACEAVVNLGLQDRYSETSKFMAEEDTPMQNLYWTLLYLDTYICGLLNQPPFLDTAGAKNATLVVMQHAAQNQSQIVRSSQKLLLNVGLALSIELFDIQKRIVKLRLPDKSRNKAKALPVPNIRQLEQELDDFKVVCDAVFPAGEVVTVVARARYELLMSFCMTSLMLAMRTETLMTEAKVAFLPGGDRENAAMRSPASIAVLAIDSAVEYLKLPAHAPTSEPSAYALFICTLCLTTAMSATKDHERRRHLATKILEGFFLVSRMACPAFAATSVYIHYIYTLGHKCGAIPHMGDSVTTTNMASCIRRGHYDQQPSIVNGGDWNMLPHDADFDQNLLSVPVVHSAVPILLTPDATDLTPPSRRYDPQSRQSRRQQHQEQQQQQGFLVPRLPTKTSSSSNSTSSSARIMSASPTPPYIFSPVSATSSQGTAQSSAGLTPFHSRTLSASLSPVPVNPGQMQINNSKRQAQQRDNNHVAYDSHQ